MLYNCALVATVSAIVKELVNDKPLLQEGLRQGIINFAALAERIKPQAEQQAGKKINDAAVIMALRRHSESMKASDVKRIKFAPHTQLTLKTNIVYFSLKRTPDLLKKLEGLYSGFDYEAGDTINIIHGNNEVSIIINDRNEKKVAKAIGHEDITTQEKNLVSISMSLEKDFLYTPGILFAVTRKLYWDDINIFEIVTTATELTFIFQKKDAMKAYSSIQELIELNS